mmetsp:Transcript_42149/g.106348  ORF Transcript_42149/g.106348 Transcript_42149/m.106348 type:complete len:223 (-) Transcript_42149:137-805(-)
MAPICRPLRSQRLLSIVFRFRLLRTRWARNASVLRPPLRPQPVSLIYRVLSPVPAHTTSSRRLLDTPLSSPIVSTTERSLLLILRLTRLLLSSLLARRRCASSRRWIVSALRCRIPSRSHCMCVIPLSRTNEWRSVHAPAPQSQCLVKLLLLLSHKPPRHQHHAFRFRTLRPPHRMTLVGVSRSVWCVRTPLAVVVALLLPPRCILRPPPPLLLLLRPLLLC